MAKSNIDELMSVGIDIGKDAFHVVAFDPAGRPVMCKSAARLGFHLAGP